MDMRRIVAIALAASLGAFFAAKTARAEYHMMNADGVYSLVNLHADEGRAKLTSVNYQLPGMIPLCTKVRFVEEGKNWVRFIVEGTGKQYTYHRHKSLRMSFYDHLDCVFGTRCTRDDAASMGRLDRRGIAEGKVYRGMSKQGVIYAIGYPPDHKTPSLQSDVWHYWSSRWNRFDVLFDRNGRVTRVRE